MHTQVGPSSQAVVTECDQCGDRSSRLSALFIGNQALNGFSLSKSLMIEYSFIGRMLSITLFKQFFQAVGQRFCVKMIFLIKLLAITKRELSVFCLFFYFLHLISAVKVTHLFTF